MKKLDLVQMEDVQGGRKLFGNQTIVGECQSTVGTTVGLCAVTSTLYIFGIGVQSSTVIKIVN